jgi:hypothetical protein
MRDCHYLWTSPEAVTDEPEAESPSMSGSVTTTSNLELIIVGGSSLDSSSDHINNPKSSSSRCNKTYL